MGMYSLASIVGPFSHISTMLCRLYGCPNTHKFSEEWVSLIEAFVDGYFMDRVAILSNNLTTQYAITDRSTIFLKERLLLSF